jgi:hypothetical protein
MADFHYVSWSVLRISRKLLSLNLIDKTSASTWVWQEEPHVPIKGCANEGIVDRFERKSSKTHQELCRRPGDYRY